MVLTFPIYGLGLYYASASSPTIGYVICCAPFFLIILFHLIDLLYKREFNLRLNGNYILAMFFFLTAIVSLFIAIGKNLPELPMRLAILKAVLSVLPYHAFIIALIYNRDSKKVVKLTFVGLTLLVFINVIGYYGLGMSNTLHNIEGRINFPFLDGLYAVGCLLAIINLMLYYLFVNGLNRPIKAVYQVAFFLLNCFFIFYINSRLSTLVFMLVMALLILNVRKKFSGVFVISLFTLPLVLNAGLLIYQILSLPFFQSVFQRSDYIDIVTFNGRSFIWESVIDWFLHDREGLLFGNGYRGHYYLDLLGGLKKVFDVKALYGVHLHSTTLEILVCQGLIGALLFFAIFYKAFIFFRRHYQSGTVEGALFPVVLFILFIVHVDTYAYLENSGTLIFSVILAIISVKIPTDRNTSSPHLRVPKKRRISLAKISE